MQKILYYTALSCGLTLLAGASALAGPAYLPPGANLTFGDVTHGARVQSASSNPAAGALEAARADDHRVSGTVLSIAAGLEYGNVDNIFEFIDEVSAAYNPSDPGSGGGPGQDPDKPDDGVDLGEIWDSLDPDVQAALEVVATEVARQVALLALIKEEGYGKAWLGADAPFVLGRADWRGAWTFGAGWSGSAKSYGIADSLEYDVEVAKTLLQERLDELPSNRPEKFKLSDDVVITANPSTNGFGLNLDNDSSFYSKATQTTELNAGYSRLVTANSAGSLYLGAEAKLYFMQLSRLSVRFGDITNSEELFNAIRDSAFNNDENLGIDFGALWVSENYQLGAQLTNINEPLFDFPDVNLDPYSSEEMIGFLMSDQTYKMGRQLKLEGSIFTDDRRWSAHAGIDANVATDPLGDDYQWVTASAGLLTDNWWVPGARVGYRKNLAGSGLTYLSFGMSAFKIFNFDISSALDTVSIDGKELPRGLMASIGFQITW
jgi:hypothetical protein